jgi:hypothetical protein
MKKISATPIRKTMTAILLFGMAGALFTSCGIPGQESIEAVYSPTPIQSSTPTIVWFPTTATPELVAVNTTTPKNASAPVFGSLVYDDAGVMTDHWPAIQENVNLVTVSKDTLVLSVNNPRGTLLSLRQDTTLSDFYFESVMTMGLCRSEDAAGIVFRTVDAQSYYAFLVNCQGRIALERVLKGSPAMLLDWSLTNQVQPGLTTPLKIGVWAQGSTIRIYINDQLQYEVINSAYYRGGIGFIAQASGDTAVSVNFSEIKIYLAAD